MEGETNEAYLVGIQRNGGGNNPLVLLEKQNPRVDKRSGGGSGGYHTESVGLIGQQGGETSLRNSICTDLFYCVVLIN